MSVPVPSPCNTNCHYDADLGVCQGCFRTLDEVARWLDMTWEEREQVMERVARRRGD
jgi:predicted Fe-S protein YdhL (DUF1289 family)